MYSDIMFHNNLLGGIQVVPRGRTDMTKKILAGFVFDRASLQ